MVLAGTGYCGDQAGCRRDTTIAGGVSSVGV